VYDVTFRRTTFHNANRTADHLVQYEWDGIAGAASQWTFEDCWFAPYTTGKWAFFAGKTALFPSNAISDVRFIGGTVAPYDSVDSPSNGANGVWVSGGVTIIGTHFEGLPYNQPRSIGIRYTGENGAYLAPSQVGFFGTGIELGNSGNEFGGSARPADESMNVHIPAGVGFNNSHCTIAGGAAINCADIRVVQTGNRRGTFIQANSNITTNNTYFGALDGQPHVVIEPAYSLTTCTNTTPIACTTSSAHGWTTGRAVMIAEQAGNTSTNGLWRITVNGPTTFTLDGSSGSGAPIINTGVVSSVSNDVLLTNWSAASGGNPQTGPVRLDNSNRRVGVNVQPNTSLHVRGVSNDCIRLDNSSNSNRIGAQICNTAANNGAFLAYDSSQSNRAIINGDGTSAFSTTGPAATDSTAILTLTSTTKGFLPPRMTTAERDAIPSPTPGLMIYNTTLGVWQGFNGSWVTIGPKND
jgi:hypothetical protein